MNCNPFTNGHRYLIEYASKQCDKLIIFVVQENSSIFSFNERMFMVRQGVKGINNIYVVPSGACILSKETFPEYFGKVKDDELVKNTEKDIYQFATNIAPAIGITKRFVGEELNDGVTNAYNNAMKKILPLHNIAVIEIPRISNSKGDIISASKCRELMKNGKMMELKEYVPHYIWEYLCGV